MRAELANLNHCAVPFFKLHRRQIALVLLYNGIQAELRTRTELRIERNCDSR